MGGIVGGIDEIVSVSSNGGEDVGEEASSTQNGTRIV